MPPKDNFEHHVCLLDNINNDQTEDVNINQTLKRTDKDHLLCIICQTSTRSIQSTIDVCFQFYLLCHRVQL